MKLIMETPILGTFIYNLYTSRTSMEKQFRNEYFYDLKKIDPADITAYVEACHRQDYRSKYAFTSYLGRYLNANIIHAVKEINHSIYILAGKEKPDNDTIVENYEYYNSSIESVLFQRFTRRETCFTRIFPRRVFFLLDNQKIPVNIGIR